MWGPCSHRTRLARQHYPVHCKVRTSCVLLAGACRTLQWLRPKRNKQMKPMKHKHTHTKASREFPIPPEQRAHNLSMWTNMTVTFTSLSPADIWPSLTSGYSWALLLGLLLVFRTISQCLSFLTEASFASSTPAPSQAMCFSKPGPVITIDVPFPQICITHPDLGLEL